MARRTLSDPNRVLDQRIGAMRRRRRGITLIITETMFLPLIGRFLGDELIANYFPTMSTFQRTVLGGVSFLALRSCVCICMRYTQLGRQTTRRILDWVIPAPNITAPNENLETNP